MSSPVASVVGNDALCAERNAARGTVAADTAAALVVAAASMAALGAAAAGTVAALVVDAGIAVALVAIADEIASAFAAGTDSDVSHAELPAAERIAIDLTAPGSVALVAEREASAPPDEATAHTAATRLSKRRSCVVEAAGLSNASAALRTNKMPGSQRSPRCR